MVLRRVGLGLGLFVAAGTDVAVLSKIWAASLAVFSQDVSTPALVLNCVEWRSRRAPMRAELLPTSEHAHRGRHRPIQTISQALQLSLQLDEFPGALCLRFSTSLPSAFVAVFLRILTMATGAPPAARCVH